MAQVITDPFFIPRSDPPFIMIHVLRENKRPVGFAPWPEDKPKKTKKKRRK